MQCIINNNITACQALLNDSILSDVMSHIQLLRCICIYLCFAFYLFLPLLALSLRLRFNGSEDAAL